MRLLVFTPTWMDADSGQAALHPRARAAIEAAMARARMSADMTIDWVVGVDNPWPIPDHRNVLHQYQRAQQATLDAGYDALLTIEHDNLLPDDEAILRMTATPAPVVYAPYLLRHGRPVLNTWQWINRRELGMSLSRYPDELDRARRAETWPICGAGMGCTLFRREALERFPFEASADNNPCPDLGFALAAVRAGVEQVARMDVPVAHYSRGKWLHPFEEDVVKYLAVESGRVASDGRIITFKAGQEIDLTDQQAEDAGRLGMIEPIGAAEPIEAEAEPSEPKTAGKRNRKKGAA